MEEEQAAAYFIEGSGFRETDALRLASLQTKSFCTSDELGGLTALQIKSSCSSHKFGGLASLQSNLLKTS